MNCPYCKNQLAEHMLKYNSKFPYYLAMSCQCRGSSYIEITNDYPKLFECQAYGFSLDYENILYRVIGFKQDKWGNENETYLSNYPERGSRLITLNCFIPLQLSDLDNQVWKLFHKLKNLVVFS